MFQVLTKENIENLPKGFLKFLEIEKELKHNPFGKYLLFVEQEVLGYIYYSEIYDRVEINDFKVDNIHRNCGIGNSLLKEFTKTVDKSITLEVRKNNYNAIHLYEKYGFKKVAIREKYYKEQDGILMEKSDKK